MGYFMMGLGIGVLGFGAFQFSAMFGLYTAQRQEETPPWLFWFFRGLSYLLMVLGLFIMAYSLVRP